MGRWNRRTRTLGSKRSKILIINIRENLLQRFILSTLANLWNLPTDNTKLFSFQFRIGVILAMWHSMKYLITFYTLCIQCILLSKCHAICNINLLLQRSFSDMIQCYLDIKEWKLRLKSIHFLKRPVSSYFRTYLY